MINEMKRVKFERMIKEINETYRSGKQQRRLLCLIFDYEKLNDYGKAIVDNAWIGLPSFQKHKCRKIGKLEKQHETAKERSWITEEFVDWCRGSAGYASYIEDGFYFLFWALMVITVDKTDKEKHLSMICNFARMLMVTDQEVKDIIELIKIVYDRSESEVLSQQTLSVPQGIEEYIVMQERKYKDLDKYIKSERTLKIFSKLLKVYTGIEGNDVNDYRLFGTFKY